MIGVAAAVTVGIAVYFAFLFGFLWLMEGGPPLRRRRPRRDR